MIVEVDPFDDAALDGLVENVAVLGPAAAVAVDELRERLSDLGVLGLLSESALDAAGEVGVPPQLQRSHEVELTLERLCDAGQLERETAVHAVVDRVDDLAEDLSAAVVGSPGHGSCLLSSESLGTYPEYGDILSVCNAEPRDGRHLRLCRP